MSFEEVWGNIYSLFCLAPESIPEMFDFKMDERVLHFGSHCLIIKAPNRFISLMKDKLRFLNHKLYMDYVKYYDKNTSNGRITVFEKPKEFQYQREFRFYVERDAIDPIVFKLGSLKEFSTIYNSEKIMSLEITPLPKSETT